MSTLDTYQADESIDFSEMGQLVASQISLMAKGASPRLDPGRPIPILSSACPRTLPYDRRHSIFIDGYVAPPQLIHDGNLTSIATTTRPLRFHHHCFPPATKKKGDIARVP
jgi:hypothetical protein